MNLNFHLHLLAVFKNPSFFSDTFSGNVGLAISQALILTGMVQYGIRQATETMQQMTSVERILQYTDLEPVFITFGGIENFRRIIILLICLLKEQSPDEKPPEEWPRTGKVKLHNMSLRYDPQGTPTLKNLRLEIESGFKVGVVGTLLKVFYKKRKNIYELKINMQYALMKKKTFLGRTGAGKSSVSNLYHCKFRKFIRVCELKYL